MHGGRKAWGEGGARGTARRGSGVAPAGSEAGQPTAALRPSQSPFQMSPWGPAQTSALRVLETSPSLSLSPREPVP